MTNLRLFRTLLRSGTCLEFQEFSTYTPKVNEGRWGGAAGVAGKLQNNKFLPTLIYKYNIGSQLQ